MRYTAKNHRSACKVGRPNCVACTMAEWIEQAWPVLERVANPGAAPTEGEDDWRVFLDVHIDNARALVSWTGPTSHPRRSEGDS